MLSSFKQSSLFCQSVVDEETKSYNMDTRFESKPALQEHSQQLLDKEPLR